tara:strand:- start:282 stop:569 length:288 start_codon:yes stop_codon:yes gene_type:complete
MTLKLGVSHARWLSMQRQHRMLSRCRAVARVPLQFDWWYWQSARGTHVAKKIAVCCMLRLIAVRLGTWQQLHRVVLQWPPSSVVMKRVGNERLKH